MICVGLPGLELEVTVPAPLPALLAVNVTLTVKLFVLVAVPLGVVTLTSPVVAPTGTVAWMVVSEVTVKVAPNALNVTAVAPVKFVPLIVTLVPTGPLVGVKLVIVGALPPTEVSVVKVKSPDVARLPAASRDFTR